MGLEKPNVQVLFNEVKVGRVVLPDFQRSFVWKAEQIRELLVSLLGKYYVGTFLYMDMVASDSPFALRLVEGVEKVAPNAKMHTLVTAILDGQQRTTSLFYALAAPDLPLRGMKGGVRFFFNIPAMLSADWDRAVSYVPSNNARALEAKRCNADEIETTKALAPTECARALKGGPHESRDWDIVQVLNDFLQYQFNHVELSKSTPLERVVETFQRINEHVGEPLSIKDLLVARLYKSGIKFRDMLADYQDEPFSYVDPEFVLKTLALVRTGEIRREVVLGLDPTNFVEDWKRAKAAVSDAQQRMLDQAKGYGSLRWQDVPSKHLIIVLAALMLRGKNLDRLDAAAYKRMDRWYWASVFENRLDAAVNTTIASDWKSMTKWMFEGGQVPDFISKFDATRVDFDVATRTHPVYRGLLGLVVLQGAHDFKTNQPPKFDLERAQVDHIFPRSQYSEHRILNSTVITSNQKKSSTIPSQYFGSLVTISTREQVVETLATHLIPEEGLDALLVDDLKGFLQIRKDAFIKAIQGRVN